MQKQIFMLFLNQLCESACFFRRLAKLDHDVVFFFQMKINVDFWFFGTKKNRTRQKKYMDWIKFLAMQNKADHYIDTEHIWFCTTIRMTFNRKSQQQNCAFLIVARSFLTFPSMPSKNSKKTLDWRHSAWNTGTSRN